MQSAFLDFASLGPGDIDARALHETLPGIALHDSTAPVDVVSRLAGVEVVLVNKIRLDAAVLEQAPALRYIGLAATGTDNVDIAAARDRGIAVTHIRNYGTPSVVQHVFGLLLALTLRLPEYRQLLAEGAWQSSDQFCLLDFPSRELAGKTFGVVGLGQLGRAVAGVAQAFGMKVIASVRPGSKVEPPAGIALLPLDQLLAAADVVSLHCPLTTDTRQMINAASVSRMRSHAVLINTARGDLVEPRALLAALQSGRLAGAGIDVLAEEPPRNGHPLLDVQLPNLIVTPHIAWAARESRQRALDEVVANVRAYLAGQRRHRLD